jgi:hypothetical protein
MAKSLESFLDVASQGDATIGGIGLGFSIDRIVDSQRRLHDERNLSNLSYLSTQSGSFGK